MERRDLLKAAGAAGAAGILGGVYVTTRPDSPDDGEEERTPDPTRTDVEEETERGTPTPHADEFETIVDAVEQGADPEGGDPVNFLFEEYADDGTLLAFEPGTYEIDYFSVYEVAQLGVVGTGEEPATFVPAAGDCRGGHPWVAFDGVSDLLLENVLFDFREADSGGPVHLLLRGETTVRDVTYLGSCSNQIAVFKVAVRDRGGSARFERVTARNVDNNHSLTGIFVTRNHAGELTFRDCNLETFSDNGLYASAPGLPDGRDGSVDIVGGTYVNNNVTNIRLGSTGSRAEDVTVVVDSETPGWGKLNARGIRLRNRSGQVIDNCEITFGADAADSFGGVVFHPDNGGAVVRDTTFTLDRDSVPAIRAFPASGAGDGTPTFENLSITGGAAGGVTARIEGRSGTVFENCTVDQTGRNRRGLLFVDSTDCRVVDSRIEVSERPVAVTSGTVEIENTRVVTPNGERRIEHQVLEDETLTVE